MGINDEELMLLEIVDHFRRRLRERDWIRELVERLLLMLIWIMLHLRVISFCRIDYGLI